MATTIKISATSEQVREPTCELTEDQLEQVSGGIIAILIGLLLPSAGPSAPPSPTRHPV
ncbi:MAG: bacteriocin [Xanthobacteraceae bacterium]